VGPSRSATGRFFPAGRIPAKGESAPLAAQGEAAVDPPPRLDAPQTFERSQGEMHHYVDSCGDPSGPVMIEDRSVHLFLRQIRKKQWQEYDRIFPDLKLMSCYITVNSK